MPALVASDLAEADFAATLGLLLDGVDEQFTASTTPTATMEAVSRLRDMPPAEQLELAAAVFAGSYPADRLGECLFVAAALQVHLAQSAALLDVAALHPVADGVCPACGSGPVASLIVGWTRAAKTRYCACSLCATQWNHVRIKCTSCSATSAILYRGVKELSENISVETCDTCHSYIKHMQQHAEPLLDPVADDIASFGLDVLVRDEGYRRGGLNPLFIQG